MGDAKYNAVAYVERRGVPVLKGCIRGELYYHPEKCDACPLKARGECHLDVVDNSKAPDPQRPGFWNDRFFEADLHRR